MKNIRLLSVIIIMVIVSVSCGYEAVVIFNGVSMEPTIIDGQKIYIEEVNLSEIERGDIIQIEMGNGISIVKRLIGMPGDTIEIYDGNIFINGEILVEDYEASDPPYEVEAITLASDEYFVLGDNRGDSRDSHDFGPIQSDQIIGRIVK